MAVVDDDEKEEDLDLARIRVWVFRVGCYDHHHYHHQPPRLLIFFDVIMLSAFSVKGKGWVFSSIVWRVA